MDKPILTLVYPDGVEQHITYDINQIGIRGRKINGKRPVTAIVRGHIDFDILKSIRQILHAIEGKIIYE